MAKPGELQYRIECTVCGRQFWVDSFPTIVPKHPTKGMREDLPYISCGGSEMIAAVTDTRVKGFD